MAKKKAIKLSEARILIFLTNTAGPNKHVGHISSKLGIDYSYCLLIIKQMLDKHWIKKGLNMGNKTFYEIAYKCPEMDNILEALN